MFADQALPNADALRRDPAASYDRAGAAPGATEGERAVIAAQIGRPARGDNAVVHRCVYGLPTVVRVAPRLEDGTPFPTVFWLTCPLATRHVGRLEAEGAMRTLSARIDEDPRLRAAYEAAHERYTAFRDGLDAPLPGDPGAGGMPTHVKCLHVHLAHHLATGDNPAGAYAYDRIAPMPCPGPCVDEAIVHEAYDGLPPGADAEAWAHAAPPAQRPNTPDGPGGRVRGGGA